MSTASNARLDLVDVIEDIRAAQRKLAVAWVTRNDEDENMAENLLGATSDLVFALGHAEEALGKLSKDESGSDIRGMVAATQGRSAEQ